ncbi:MAG: HAD-superfamily subfamily hydrolase [Actinomycetia bacterium]|nr:HAD-superfamily subfamily hydrolase [Actinomycetes bacterium]
MNEPSPRVVAAFDFDGTLTRRDSMFPFLVEIAGIGRVSRALLADAVRIARVAAGRGDRDVVKANLIARVTTGLDWSDVHKRGQAYARLLVAQRLRPEALHRLRWHLAQGHDVVIVSASLDAYLHDVAELLGVGAVLCTTFERDELGRVTGRLVGGNCRGPEKATRLREHLGRELGGATVELWAYGDSSGDRELLAMADRPVRVTKRGRLLDVTRRG